MPMHELTRFSHLIVSLAAAVMIAMMFACGANSNISRHKSLPVVTLGPDAPWGDVASDRTLSYDGRTFRLKAMQEAQFVDPTAFTPVGMGLVEGSRDLTQVFVRGSEVNTVFTSTPAGVAPEWVHPANVSPPALWYQWQISS